MAAKKEVVKVIEVVRTGETIGIPETMTITQAIDALYRKQTEEEEITSFTERVAAVPYDGAHAMVKAMEELFGYVAAKPTPGFFGPTPPQMISVDTGVGQSVLVPWGRFELPGIEGNVNTSTWTTTDSLMQFAIVANVKRKNEPHIRKLAKRTREIVETSSLYRGKALRIKFYDDDGERIAIPAPTFLDLRNVREDELIYPADVQHAVETNLFAPIEYADACRKHKIPLKRGILLSGKYGVGKTLCAFVAAKKAEDHARTFVYVTKASELPDAIHFAQQYSPAIVFCEDIDQETSGGRDDDMNEILNTIDGIDSKASEVIVVMTTNHVENIIPAMLRPGRIDALIEVTPPDRVAVERLLRLYGRGLIPAQENLDEVAEYLDGTIPAVLREVVEKAKLAAVYLTKGADNLVISSEALLIAAKSLDPQRRILEGATGEHVELAPGEAISRGFEALLAKENDGKLDEKLEELRVFVEDTTHSKRLFGKVMSQ